MDRHAPAFFDGFPKCRVDLRYDDLYDHDGDRACDNKWVCWAYVGEFGTVLWRMAYPEPIGKLTDKAHRLAYGHRAGGIPSEQRVQILGLRKVIGR